MATFTLQVLADGQCEASATAIFTATTDTYLHNVNFVNVSGVSQTVILYFQRTTQRELGRALLSATGYRWEYLEHPIHMESGDILLATSTTATSVDYVVTGVEQT
jgi:hypothetical protein